MLTPVTDAIAAMDLPEGCRSEEIGASAADRPLLGVSVGNADLPLVSIVAGAHPDEPAGPLAAHALLGSWGSDPVDHQVRLAVVPLLDVDGVIAQRAWLEPWDGAIDLARYLEHRIRRLPGEDREFAWPGAPWGGTVLPECAAADTFLDAQGPAIAHLTLHGMFAALGPWYLLDRPVLQDPQLWLDLRAAADAAGLPLHEFHRYGDKGFRRVGRGFCTTPSGPAMRRHFLALGDRATADGFGYGSMDAARARARAAGAPEPIVAISEFPLLQLPEADPEETRTARQQAERLAADGRFDAAAALMLDAGCSPVPMADQVNGMVAMVRAVIRSALRRIA